MSCVTCSIDAIAVNSELLAATSVVGGAPETVASRGQGRFSSHEWMTTGKPEHRGALGQAVFLTSAPVPGSPTPRAGHGVRPLREFRGHHTQFGGHGGDMVI
jgi:hypothetical protein